MPDFERDDRISLDYGVVLHSSDVSGNVGDVRRWAGAQAPVREAEPVALPDQLAADKVPPEAAQSLGTAVQDAGLRPVLSLPLTNLIVPPRPAGRERGKTAAPFVELEVPAPRENEGQVLLEVDETGVARWVFAQPAIRAGAERAEAAQFFRIPNDQLHIPVEGTERGLAGFGFRKVVHLLRFPIEKAAGAAAELAVGLWEDQYRPYGLRLTTRETFLTPTAGEPVSAARLAELADQPFLVFVHGTFSRCGSGFHGIADDVQLLNRLHQQYPNRVLVFDHPTVHLDPAANAKWLLQHLPSDRQLTLDLVVHSRGGLVARELGQPQVVQAAGTRAPCLRTLIHVATPNAGTVLASKQRLGDLLDVFTNLLALFPDGMVGTTIEVVLEVVKHCAVGALGGLDGLAAMDPASPTLRALNKVSISTTGTVHAVTSNFEPSAGAGITIRTLDLLMDRMFDKAGNDLVVPTDGVGQADAYMVQNPVVIPTANAVAHTHFFDDDLVRQSLAAWL
jgi:hypothetical protein